MYHLFHRTRLCIVLVILLKVQKYKLHVIRGKTTMGSWERVILTCFSRKSTILVKITVCVAYYPTPQGFIPWK